MAIGPSAVGVATEAMAKAREYLKDVAIPHYSSDVFFIGQNQSHVSSWVCESWKRRWRGVRHTTFLTLFLLSAFGYLLQCACLRRNWKSCDLFCSQSSFYCPRFAVQRKHWLFEIRYITCSKKQFLIKFSTKTISEFIAYVAFLFFIQHRKRAGSSHHSHLQAVNRWDYRQHPKPDKQTKTHTSW